MGFIFQPGKLLLGKALENLMDRLSTHVYIACNRFRVPAVNMQADHQSSALLPALDFRVARVAALRRRGLGTGGQNELDGGRGRLAIEFDKANRCDLMRAECRVLRM